MGENTKQLESIWGKWWEPIRKWFYPTWCIYEVSIRFYDYSQSIYVYFIEQQNHLGEINAQILAVFFSFISFAICTLYLTIPSCFTLYKLFKEYNLTNTKFEQKIKKIF